jgi:hypothetical protein
MGFLAVRAGLAGQLAQDRANVRAHVVADQPLYGEVLAAAARRGWGVCWPGCPRQHAGKRLPLCPTLSPLNQIVTIPIFSCLDG